MTDAELEYLEAITEVMHSPDPLAAAHACIERQKREIAVLRQSCLHFQHQQAEARRLLEIATRRAAALTRRIEAQQRSHHDHA